MRIVTSFNAATLKITLFTYQGKYTIKVQDKGYEFIIPLDDIDNNQIAETVEYYSKLPETIKSFKEIIQRMHDNRINITKELMADEDQFDKII